MNHLTIKPFIVSITFLTFLVLLPKSIFAADFSFDYDISYSVSEDGKTEVEQLTRITNEQSTLYAQNYTINLASQNISNVSASDQTGELDPQVATSSGQTVITIPLKYKALGEGQQTIFTLKYTTTDIAQKKGRIWEIIIPGINDSNEIKSYAVSLNTPESFGEPTVLSPKPNQGFRWIFDQAKNVGITAVFGDYQNYAYELRYHLKNDSQEEQLQEISFPPDTPYQKNILQNISQKPESMHTDIDGNWLGRYLVKPGQKVDITASGTMVVFSSPQYTEQLSSVQKQKYIQEQRYWEQSEQIASAAAEKNSSEAIYNSIIDTLEYDYSRLVPNVKRLGAQEALQNPNTSICMEYTDVFIALARNKKIPSRAVFGYAQTSNPLLQPLSVSQDVLHAWPQYFDEEKKVFVQVDPTWGDTTRGVDYFNSWDFNHVALAILGNESDYPYPAGAYASTDDSKTVFFEPKSDDVTIPDPSVEFSLSLQPFIISGSSASAHILLKNTGTVAFDISSLKTSDIQIPQESSIVPPFGSKDIPALLTNEKIWGISNRKITVSYGENSRTQSMTILPFYTPLLGYGTLVLFVLFILGNVRRKFKKSSQTPPETPGSVPVS